MVQVDHVVMFVRNRAVAVRMVMRFRGFPSVVFMLMMLVVNMRMLMVKRAMMVFDVPDVFLRPEGDGGGGSGQG